MQIWTELVPKGLIVNQWVLVQAMALTGANFDEDASDKFENIVYPLSCTY